MSTQKEHKCPVCPYSDNSITIMQVHCINVHPRGFVTCPWCTAPFGTISALKCHREQCSKFNKRDPREGDVNHRVALLTNNKCSLCEGRFHTQETAIRHYKELHLNFVYFCGVCKQHFEKLSNMKKHEAESHRKTPTDSFAASPANRKRIVADVSLSEKRCFTKWFNSKRCYDCKIGFESIAEVSEHFKMEHHTTYYDCDECGNAYLSLGARCKHKKLKHQPRRVRSILSFILIATSKYKLSSVFP